MNIVFIETPEFINKIDEIVSEDEFHDLQDELIKNPYKGKIDKGTGGARKIRLKIRGKGKSGGARVIYYYLDMMGEIWFLEAYLKSKKASLTASEKKSIYRFIKETVCLNKSEL